MIRPARESDIQQIRFLAQTSFAPFVTRLGAKFKPPQIDFRHQVAAGHVHVCMIDNAVRGFIIFRIDGMDVHVEHLAVAGRFRRMGIGRSLLSHADVVGLSQHCLRVVLHSSVVLFENIAYFRGRGFQEIDRRFVDGQEQVYFERHLR